ncbi:MAG: NUDIX hydrolase [Woeseiaceae bacterium]|nr:NUDIX hydrolase [Woeseiaceae bacterium]
MSWRRLNSRVIWENPWMRVLEDRVINPRGGENDYGHIQFLNRAVAIVPIDDDEHTWLVGQHRYTLDAYSWELPMGGAPLNEDLLAAAQRELLEETGLSAKQWTEVMRLHLSNSITDETGIVFVAEELAAGEPDFDETEVLDIRRLPLAEAVAMAESGEITDALSVVALLRVARLRATS